MIIEVKVEVKVEVKLKVKVKVVGEVEVGGEIDKSYYSKVVQNIWKYWIYKFGIWNKC